MIARRIRVSCAVAGMFVTVFGAGRQPINVALACSCEDTMALVEDNALIHEIGRDLARASRERAEAAQIAATCPDFNSRLPKTDVLLQEASELNLASMDAYFAGQAAVVLWHSVALILKKGTPPSRGRPIGAAS